MKYFDLFMGVLDQSGILCEKTDKNLKNSKDDFENLFDIYK
jgi:hypothetical protein